MYNHGNCFIWGYFKNIIYGQFLYIIINFTLSNDIFIIICTTFRYCLFYNLNLLISFKGKAVLTQ